MLGWTRALEGRGIVVPVESSGALDKQVDRSKVAYEHIEVDIEALLGNLRGDEDDVAWCCGFFAQRVNRPHFDIFTLLGGIAGVE